MGAIVFLMSMAGAIFTIGLLIAVVMLMIFAIDNNDFLRMVASIVSIIGVLACIAVFLYQVMG